MTRIVPEVVPSVFQSVLSALKNTMPLTFVKPYGFELLGPGTMSLISTVPLAVPLVFHSSLPLLSSWALNIGGCSNGN